jgi:hypothetical protein
LFFSEFFNLIFDSISDLFNSSLSEFIQKTLDILFNTVVETLVIGHDNFSFMSLVVKVSLELVFCSQLI